MKKVKLLLTVILPLSVLGLALQLLGLNTKFKKASVPYRDSKRLNGATVKEGASRFVSMSTTQLQRLEMVKRFCKRSKRRIKPLEQHVIYNIPHRFAYCEIGKVASTTWIEVLKALIGDRTRGRKSRLLRQKRNNARRRRFGHDMFKFTFVRHPFDRLVSAYFDKFRRKSEFSETLVPKIIHRYRSKSSSLVDDGDSRQSQMRSLSNRSFANENSAVTFEEFIQYITDQQMQPLNDFHWSPMVELCPPCRIHFDFIGHYETFDQDAEYVLHRLGIPEELAKMRGQGSMSGTERAARVRSLMSKLSTKQINRLMYLYRSDFQAFGYQPNY